MSYYKVKVNNDSVILLQKKKVDQLNWIDILDYNPRIKEHLVLNTFGTLE